MKYFVILAFLAVAFAATLKKGPETKLSSPFNADSEIEVINGDEERIQESESITYEIFCFNILLIFRTFNIIIIFFFGEQSLPRLFCHGNYVVLYANSKSKCLAVSHNMAYHH